MKTASVFKSAPKVRSTLLHVPTYFTNLMLHCLLVMPYYVLYMEIVAYTVLARMNTPPSVCVSQHVCTYVWCQLTLAIQCLYRIKDILQIGSLQNKLN